MHVPAFPAQHGKHFGAVHALGDQAKPSVHLPAFAVNAEEPADADFDGKQGRSEDQDVDEYLERERVNAAATSFRSGAKRSTGRRTPSGDATTLHWGRSTETPKQ